MIQITGIPLSQAGRHVTRINNAFQPSLANLRHHVEYLVLLAHKKNTHSVYDRAWDICMAHLQLYYKSLFALKEFDGIEFVAFLSMASLAPATILSYISGVKYHLRIRFLNIFSDSFLLKLVAKGIASQQHQPDVRLPITMDILVKMLHALPIVHINPHKVCMYRAVLVAGFYMCCWCKAYSSNHIEWC